MPRAARNQLCPWIEALILSYGSREEEGGCGRLKAHVIGVGQMTQSQAQGSEGLTGLLFLSDGALQIPAVLTASAWERLQEHEDRECFTSLLNTTVCVQDCRLRFHMAPQKIRCRFFLSVGELATTAAGPVKENTPCSTTLPSVRRKICETWRAQRGRQEEEEAPDSQKSQCGFDLSELLGEWQHDCVQAVLDDVRERLVAASRLRPVSPRPSTSADASSPPHPDSPTTATGWDVDRVRYKGAERFSVPVKCLLIPEEDAQRKPASAAAAQASVDDAEWRLSTPAVAERGPDPCETSPPPAEHRTPHEDTTTPVIVNDIVLLTNPWDMFRPPSSSSSSDTSPQTSPTNTLRRKPTAATSTPHDVAALTSTQLPERSPGETQQSSGEHSFIPPYQKPPLSSCVPGTAASSSAPSSSVIPPEPFSRPSDPSANATDELARNPSSVHRDGEIWSKDTKETVEVKHRKAKRKRSEPTPDVEEEQVSGNPPSWLFDDTQAAASGAEEVTGGHNQGQSAASVLRKTPTVHSGGRPFTYSYKVSGQNLQDLGRFQVAESLLRWAVKYLVPERTENLHNGSATSDRTKVTSL
ncbi:adrenocortical dysplasia protein homolog [Scophthalmus maximus]|uniref:adrenocortical dysplasia protein homolog n=1 Tax=Scophthalmus maximus TaxID=52904 RepID=UPI001FA88BE8|nr:adrenocortical dysplasia protein homolog [Scophthalmus maximus]XP_035498449.2 adrenocortical dysplasia protein homolog [Scophthalmus maximus]